MRVSNRHRLPMIAPVLLLSLATLACAPKLKMRPTLAGDLSKLGDQIEVLPPFPEPKPQSGSLWIAGGPGASLVRDHRAFRLNDLVTIVLSESAAGSQQSSTDLKRSSDASLNAPLAFGVDNLNEIFETQLSSNSEFSGDGTTARSTSVQGMITARVMRVLPNGDLVVAAQKTVMVNREKQMLTIVGSVRPVDVNSRNRVPSSSVGDLTVRLWGSGEVDDTIRQGWFMRTLNKLWPF